jgi:hypothetical protein
MKKGGDQVIPEIQRKKKQAQNKRERVRREGEKK